MDPQVSASFIPKKPLAETRSSGEGAYGLVFLVALLIFITSLLAAGGAFLYGKYLSTSLGAKQDQLKTYQQAYDLSTIQTLVRFDSRINESRTILEHHLAPSAIFTFLSQQTLEKVQFTNFDYSLSAADHTVVIKMQGTADSFATVALQSDQLGSSKSLRDVVFSDISVEQGGRVGFSVSAKVDPALILYSNNINSDQILVPAVPDQTSISSSTASTTP
jgi:hypothetical protein